MKKMDVLTRLKMCEWPYLPVRRSILPVKQCKQQAYRMIRVWCQDSSMAGRGIAYRAVRLVGSSFAAATAQQQ